MDNKETNHGTYLLAQDGVYRSEDQIHWSRISDPFSWDDTDIGEPVLECKSRDEARRIERACNQGKVAILEMWRRLRLR